MDKFNKTLQTTMQQYDETFTKLAAGENTPAKTELLVRDLEDLLDEDGLNSLSRVGIELVDKKTKERLTYIASSAWINKEWDELTITVDVGRLPEVEE